MNNHYKTVSIISFFIAIFIFSLWGLGSALTPLSISFLLSYLLFPIMKKIEAKGISRLITISIIFSILILLTLSLMGLILPSLIKDTQNFITDLPINTSKAIDKIESISSSFGYQLKINKESLKILIQNQASNISGEMLKNITTGITSSITGFIQFIISILNIFLIPLFFFYVMNDYEKISNEFKTLFPPSVWPTLNKYGLLCNRVLSGYIRGQLMVAFSLSLLYATGLSLIGLKYGFLIGIISGLISIIPYAGFTIGIITALIISIANYTGPLLLIGIILVFSIIQTLDGLLITPRLVGNKVGLNPLTTMISLIIGGNILGLIGMIFAIPVAGILKITINNLRENYIQN